MLPVEMEVKILVIRLIEQKGCYSTANNTNDNRSNDNNTMYCNLQQQQLNQTKTAKTYNNILLVGI